MYKRYFVQCHELKIGMRIDQTIVDRTERVIVTRGTVLTPQLVETLRKQELTGVYISEGIKTVMDEEDGVSAKAFAVIKEFKGDGCPKVEFDFNTKRQVAAGVDYLFHHYEMPELLLAAKSVVERILNTIEENRAEMVDISLLNIGSCYLYKHSVDVCILTMMLARQCGFTDDQIIEAGITGLLHDIGMVQVDEEIVNKPKSLNEEEFAILKRHTVFGISILKNKQFINDNILSGVLGHHERNNGQGYPMKTKINGIHPYARMIAIADVFSALITERPYKKAFSPNEAMEMIMSMTDALDIDIIRHFIRMVVLYPEGSDVQLSNGEKARVVCNYADYVMRPTVVGLKSGKVYDLAHDFRCANIIVM